MPTTQPVTSVTDPGPTLDSLHPMSRPSSLGPLNRLALTSKKRTAVPTPAPTLVQDGSYLEALSLKLSEAVSRALAQPTGTPATGEVIWNGRRALPKGRGSALGSLIGSELEAAASNPHLLRAILRSLHKPLSVLLTNVSTQLLPVISSVQFTAHPTPSVPSGAQLYALSYANFVAELLEKLDGHKLAESDNHGSHGTAENLRNVRESLESLIGRVVNPFGQAIKNELLPLVEALEYNNKSPVTSPVLGKQGTVPNKGNTHPSVVSLHNLVPPHAKNLAMLTTLPTTVSQTMLATLLISLIWRSLVALSNRGFVASTARQVAGSVVVPGMAPVSRKKILSNSTPPTTPPASRFTIKLPPSRPPSPPGQHRSTPAADARAVLELFQQFPRPNDSSRYALAREAVEEAYSGLAALCALLDCEVNGDLEDLEAITADLPTVIALPILLRMFVRHETDGSGDTVAGLLGVPEQEYRSACLTGFSRAEECGPVVAKRILDGLKQRQVVNDDRFVGWLENRISLEDQ